MDELEACSVWSTSWASAPVACGVASHSRGTLYLMLQNRIYRSEIVHKKQSYPGERSPIIDR
jgi:hypothetical protein